MLSFLLLLMCIQLQLHQSQIYDALDMIQISLDTVEHSVVFNLSRSHQDLLAEFTTLGLHTRDQDFLLQKIIDKQRLQKGLRQHAVPIAATSIQTILHEGIDRLACDEEEEEDEDDDGFEDAGGETSELGVPLLVTTELAARGVDFKAMCASASLCLPHAHGHYQPGPPRPDPSLPHPPLPLPPHTLSPHCTPTAGPSAAVAPRLLAAASPHPASPPSPRPCSDVVFMLGLPTRLDSYVHVAGRTAREGRKGHAISLLTSSQQEERFAQYKSELGLKAEVIDLRFLS